MCCVCFLPLNALSNITALTHLFLALVCAAVRFKSVREKVGLGTKFSVVHTGTVLVGDERRADSP